MAYEPGIALFMTESGSLAHRKFLVDISGVRNL